MAISTSLPISLSTIKTELGLTGSDSLLDCFANASASGFDATYGAITDNNQQAFRGYAEPTTGNTLKVTPTTVTTNASASSNNISVTSNTTWTVTEGLSWVSISGAANTGNDTFTLSILINNTGSPRSGDVTVSTTSGSPSIVRVIAVSQGSGFE